MKYTVLIACRLSDVEVWFKDLDQVMLLVVIDSETIPDIQDPGLMHVNITASAIEFLVTWL